MSTKHTIHNLLSIFFRPRKYECKLLLRNTSQLLCEIEVSLDENSPYSLKSNALILDPAQEAYLPISIKANKSGLLQSNLCISIKNNPRSQIIKLVTKPCKLDFHIRPKVLVFEKIPVNCGTTKKINLSNLTPVNLLWRFIDFNWALEIFKISKTEGTLRPFSVFDVTMSYTPHQEESHPKKQLAIEVSHKFNEVEYFLVL